MSLQGIIPLMTRPEAAKRAQQVIDAMDEAIGDIRTAIFSLHSRQQHSGSALRARIVAIAEEAAPMLGFAPTVRLGGGLDENVPAGPAEQLLTVLREALSNSARHANASHVEVSAEADGDLVLRVIDNGIGLGPSTRRSGLANMSERARQLGGTLSVGPADLTTGTGTLLEWTVPLR
jgi:signal transduction histidine kinase